ncbi:MAG: hypothetical protein ACREV3_06550 [Gammaproteobacteria bacterium]
MAQDETEHLLMAEAKYGALLREEPKRQPPGKKIVLTDEEELFNKADKNADRGASLMRALESWPNPATFAASDLLPLCAFSGSG